MRWVELQYLMGEEGIIGNFRKYMGAIQRRQIEFLVNQHVYSEDPGKEPFLTNTHLPFLAVAYFFLFVDCFPIGTHCHTVLVLAIFKCERFHVKEEETDLVYIGYYLY